MPGKFLLALSLAFTVPGAYAGGKDIPRELNDLVGKKPGIVEQKDLSRFYDGSKVTGDSAGSLNGSRPAEINGSRPIVAEMPEPYLDIIKYPIPPGLPDYEPGGARAGKEPAAAAKRGNGRPLTDAELAAARKIFGDKIDYSKVKIVPVEDLTLWGKILTRDNYNVAWANTIYYADKNPGTDVFIHEMAHVYQYQNGGWGYFPTSMWEQLTQGYGAYRYQLEPGKALGEYGIEQQANIIQDYYKKAISPSLVPEVEKILRKEGLLGGVISGFDVRF